MSKAVKGIATYAVFKPAYAVGTGKFIKQAEHQRFHTQRQREAIIQRNRRYLAKHRHKLQVFALYEHPGNQLILRWPARHDQAHSLRLWLYYKPEHRQHDRCDADGCHTLIKYHAPEDHAKQADLFERLATLAACQIDNGYLWLARIYAHPGNQVLFTWSEDKGESQPGHVLETVAQAADYEDLLRELDQLSP